MIIQKINFIDGETRVVIKEIQGTTFVFKDLSLINSKQDFINEILTKMPQTNEEEDKYNNLNLKSLEGTEI